MGDASLTNQAKLDLLHDTRQAFGRSVLVLQGGSIFGLCHIGVIKALHLRGLLPRIISGTATGALMAALVGVHNEDELLKFLSGEGIDLTAFATRSAQMAKNSNGSGIQHGFFSTWFRRMKRFVTEGYLLDASVLEECVRANVGDLTFMEAYQRTKRVLNITVAPMGNGMPNLLNYLTAPNVVRGQVSSSSKQTLTRSPAHLVRSLGLERFRRSLLSSNHEMQRRIGQHRSLGFHSSYEPTSYNAPRVRLGTRLSSCSHRRTIQRESLRCVSSSPLHCTLSP